MRSQVGGGDERKRKLGDFYRDCPVKPDNDIRRRNSSLRNFSLGNSKTRGSGVKLGSKVVR